MNSGRRSRNSLCKTCAHSKNSSIDQAFSFCTLHDRNHGAVAKCYSYQGPDFPVDIAIITAARVETEMVAEHLLPDGVVAWHSIQRMTELEWRRAEYIVDQQTKIRLVLAQSMRKGLPAAAVQATRAWHIFRPSYLVMLGITAGRQGETRLGDIVVPDVVYDYGAGKWSGSKFIPEPHQSELDNDCFRACHHLAINKSEMLRRIADDWKGNLPEGKKDLKVCLGHMASGAAVVDSGEIWERVLAHDKSVIAIDMEAYSILVAGRQVGPPKPKVLVAKSVCDYGVNKDDGSQKYAAYTSARFFRMFIQEILAKDPELALVQSA